MQGLVSFYLTGMAIVVAAAMYLLPTLVAWLRHAPDLAATAVVNVALGWTFIGWIIALAMALRKAPSPAVQVFNQVNAPSALPQADGHGRPDHFAQHLDVDQTWPPSAGPVIPPGA